ncbi:Eco57I restriction-modification methylase domain-containing protein, partial [Oscillochloris sp. ZM17-4]|uniref:Eco57I restriction-modification methylase domain-containing protein n=1 Tax=Oscillochloris sp. ZM17-4 TaxID=2866714 RepID=UPI001C72B001
LSQLSLLDDPAFAGAMMSAVGSMWLIEGSAGRTVDEVKEQEQIYERVRRELTERFALHADLRTAADLGQGIAADLQQRVVEFERRNALGQLPPSLLREVERVQALAAARRFFHWDLEFPEVFYDRHGRPLGERAGFDAVIGNPPYVRQEQLGPLKPFFQRAFPETYSGTADLFVYFFQQGVRLLREGGLLGYIASNSWLRANYATPLRAFMRQQVTVEQLIDLGDNRVFADAPDVYPAIPIVRRAAPPDDHTAQAATFSRGEGLREFERQIVAKLAPVSIHDQQDSGWQLGGDAGRRVFAKMMSIGQSLGDVLKGRIYYGIKTGANDVFIIDEITKNALVASDRSSAEIIKPLIQGEDLRPWHYEYQDRWLIFTRRGIDIDRYPAVKAYLESYRARLEPKPRDWMEEHPWSGRKPGSYKWYELQDSVDYFSAFDLPKIVWPDIAKSPRFSWDTEAMYLGNTGYIAIIDHPWVLGYLASRCAWFLISQSAISLGERAGVMRYRLIDQYMRPLPIPDAPEAEREAIGGLAMTISGEAKARYELHRRARRRILSDLGAADKKLNQKLTAWWDLDFAALRAEVQKVFRRDIPLRERDDWEEWLGIQREGHRQRTAAIIAGEAELNRRVYQLFDLSAEEVAIIEASTRYGYGEV